MFGMLLFSIWEFPFGVRVTSVKGVDEFKTGFLLLTGLTLKITVLLNKSLTKKNKILCCITQIHSAI